MKGLNCENEKMMWSMEEIIAQLPSLYERELKSVILWLISLLGNHLAEQSSKNWRVLSTTARVVYILQNK